MRKDELFPSKYVKASDIDESEPIVVIAKVEIEKVGDDTKPVVYFQNATKGLVCNLTNFDRIAFCAGSDETNDWPGTEIQLYSELVTFQGKTAPAIRVRKPPKRPAQQAVTSPPQQASQKNGTTSHTAVDRGNYDVMERRKTEPAQSAGHDVPSDEIPF